MDILKMWPNHQKEINNLNMHNKWGDRNSKEKGPESVWFKAELYRLLKAYSQSFLNHLA